MYCKICGKEMQDGARFCPSCGASGGQASARKALGGDSAAGKSNKGLIFGIVASVVLLAVLVTAIVLWKSPGKEDENAMAGALNGSNQNASGEASGGQAVSRGVEYTPLYQLDFISAIDLSRQDHIPGEKQAGMTWDRTIFYWLETAQEEGGATGISTCDISRMQLYNTASQKVIEYIVYKDHFTGEIYKIVSIEPRKEDLLLTDYYYQDGKPNFIFRRGDSVYTPTYATIGKVGERYYFDNDVLVKWRVINTPNVIEEQTLTVNPSADYSQKDYYAMGSGSQEDYDAVENNLLNLAYATYDRIVQGESIGNVTGSITDAAGNPLEGRTVCIYRSEDDELLYTGVTDEKGNFLIYVYTDGTDCYLTVPGEEIYRDLHAENLLLSMDLISYGYGKLTMYSADEPEHEVTLRLCDASTLHTKNGAGQQGTGQGAEQASGLDGAEVTFREGISVRTGEAVLRAEADDEGNVAVRLNAGLYTAEVEKEGYAPLYVNIKAAGEEKIDLGDYYLAPAPEDGHTAVLLTWEGGETDLDLTIFTPYQDNAGDMQHIGGSKLGDAYGNYILSDNESGCELAYIDTENPGSYKIYVNDYTDTQAGRYSTDVLAGLNVRLYIFSADGDMAEYRMPADADGVVWEAAELHGGRLTAGNRVYDDLTGKGWWLAEKKVFTDEIKQMYAQAIREEYYEAREYNSAYQEYGGTDISKVKRYQLIYIDGDAIPEIYCEGEYVSRMVEHSLFYIQDGEVKRYEFDTRGVLQYIPYGGVLTIWYSFMEEIMEDEYTFPDFYEIAKYVDSFDGIEHWVDGEPATEKEYENRVKEYGPGSAFVDVEGSMTYDEIMEFLGAE